ncbi:MAG: hypothetical protein IEMM0007_0178 [bacterium]|nr:MAG: hypothetical protein IEMM0007_0178 [bacterium]
MHRSRKLKFFVTVLAVLLLLSATYVLYMEEQGNFHPITEGEAYRSAQMDRDELEYYISRYNIKSILNLRGENTGKKWYTEELKVSRAHNVNHYDISLSATRGPSDQDVDKLIEIFKSAARPFLPVYFIGLSGLLPINNNVFYHCIRDFAAITGHSSHLQCLLFGEPHRHIKKTNVRSETMVAPDGTSQM